LSEKNLDLILRYKIEFNSQGVALAQNKVDKCKKWTGG
jgi:hypothetical protein